MRECIDQRPAAGGGSRWRSSPSTTARPDATGEILDGLAAADQRHPLSSTRPTQDCLMARNAGHGRQRHGSLPVLPGQRRPVDRPDVSGGASCCPGRRRARSGCRSCSTADAVPRSRGGRSRPGSGSPTTTPVAPDFDEVPCPVQDLLDRDGHQRTHYRSQRLPLPAAPRSWPDERNGTAASIRASPTRTTCSRSRCCSTAGTGRARPE